MLILIVYLNLPLQDIKWAVSLSDKFSLDWISNYFRISTCRAEAKESSYNTYSGKLPFTIFLPSNNSIITAMNNNTSVLLFIAVMFCLGNYLHLNSQNIIWQVRFLSFSPYVLILNVNQNVKANLLLLIKKAIYF